MPFIPQISGIGGEVAWVDPDHFLILSLLVIGANRKQISHSILLKLIFHGLLRKITSDLLTNYQGLSSHQILHNSPQVVFILPFRIIALELRDIRNIPNMVSKSRFINIF